MMLLLTTILTGIGLSMDAFAVAVCMGLSMKTSSLGNLLKWGSTLEAFRLLCRL